MLVSLQEIIGLAEKENFCVPAFNVYNIETVMGGSRRGGRGESSDYHAGLSPPF